mgnify:CR=1 FL=1
MYQAIDIQKVEKGKYVVVTSDYVENIFDIANEYPYISKNFFKIFDLDLGTEIDYEDMENDDLNNIQKNFKTLIFVEIKINLPTNIYFFLRHFYW